MFRVQATTSAIDYSFSSGFKRVLQNGTGVSGEPIISKDFFCSSNKIPKGHLRFFTRYGNGDGGKVRLACIIGLLSFLMAVD